MKLSALRPDWTRRPDRESVDEIALRLSSGVSELERATLDLRLQVDRLQGVKTAAGEE